MTERSLNILFASAGRRVGLLELFRSTLEELGVRGRLFAADADPTAPTLHKADAMVVFPPVTSSDYVETLRAFCVENEIRLVIPLIDPELDVLAGVRDSLLNDGIVVMVSAKSAIEMVQDKIQTAALFNSVGLPSPRTMSVTDGGAEQILDSIGLPLVLKPRFGSSGKGVFICTTEIAVRRALQDIDGAYIAQQFVGGVEVTTDLFGDGHGNVLSLVPRKRLKVRGGEVERGVTVSDSLFRDDLLRLARSLKPFGAVNVQCFVSEQGPMYTEINGRFGGGYPLAHAAGARFPELIIRMALGQVPRSVLGEYDVGVVMSRYDEAVYMDVNRLPNAEKIMQLPGDGAKHKR